jgi:site-specific recombinase XerD
VKLCQRHLEEVAWPIEAAPGPKYKAALGVAYGASLRVSEVANLRVSDINSKRMVIRVEQGKGNKHCRFLSIADSVPVIADSF